VSERSEEVRHAREEIEQLEASRLRLSEAVMRGDHEARKEDEQLERRLWDLSRLIMQYERDKEEARRGATERRGEEFREASRRNHPQEEGEDREQDRRKRGRSS
jgi:hypothetical protein